MAPQMIGEKRSLEVESSRNKTRKIDIKFISTREEKVDLDTLTYLIRLILSHEQYGTTAPDWLVSEDPYDEAATQTKGEFIKSTLMSMYWGKQSLYRHTYYQKEDTNGYYGGWILKKPASYLTSAHAMKRELRANLFSKNYIDCDIENAFPCLLLGLLEGYHPYEHLWRYVHERETVLKEIIDEKDCSREEAKKNVLALMFKDPTKDWYGLSTFEKSFEAEMKAIGGRLLAEENIDWVKRSQKKHAGAGLSLLLQTKCALCLKEGVLELQRHGCRTGALIFDGCLVEKSDRVKTAMDKLNQKMRETPEYKFVKFTVKPFGDLVDTSMELPVKFNLLLIRICCGWGCN